MECAPTLDVVDGPYEDEEEEVPEVWGRLFPLGKGFVSLDLVKDEYKFGRGEECEYCFPERGGKLNPHFAALSTTHFIIYRKRDKSDPDQYVVFIKDKSSNGTFVNGEKIGKNKTQVLNNNDEIALALKKNKVFIFSECGVSDSDRLPEDFREKYTMSKPLGRGACGEVKLAFEKGSCNKFAVKIISKKTFSVGPKLGRAVMDEVKILMAMHHPCIICIEDVFDSPEALYIVLELVEGGELFDRVVDVGKFTEPIAKLLFYQMLVAVKYLHDKGITHRDLKPENVLLATDDKETLIKVTDFGLSKFVGENSLMKTLCGTPSYLAPEVIKSAGMGGYDKKVDCWSLGVILYIMLGGYPPFSDEITEYSLHDQICQGRYSFPEAYWKNVSKEALDLIRQLLKVDAKKRITTANALQHPWMQDKEIISRAKKLMGEAAGKINMPPPHLPGRKRPASSSDEEMPTKPKKKLTLDASSPMDEALPLTTPISDENHMQPLTTPISDENHMQPSESTASTTTTGSLSDESKESPETERRAGRPTAMSTGL